jgi:hypothetical protein
MNILIPKINNIISFLQFFSFSLFTLFPSLLIDPSQKCHDQLIGDQACQNAKHISFDFSLEPGIHLQINDEQHSLQFDEK